MQKLAGFHRLRWSTSWIIAQPRGSVPRLVTQLASAAFRRSEVNEMETQQQRPATKKQLAYIRLLAKRVGASLYLGNIKTIEEASTMIDSLKRQSRSPPAQR